MTSQTTIALIKLLRKKPSDKIMLCTFRRNKVSIEVPKQRKDHGYLRMISHINIYVWNMYEIFSLIFRYETKRKRDEKRRTNEAIHRFTGKQSK